MLRVTRYCVETVRLDRRGREVREVEQFYTHREAVDVVMMRHRRGLRVSFWEARYEPVTGLSAPPRSLRLVGQASDRPNVVALSPRSRSA